ncbi:MAG: hypothetical protein COA96_16300 [SAR86 cluster bacterium]|uniref:Uncharacterized protein n=1 Tax=SAR86 cluster bacterium TaxID=2030880 RepID=A0A2A5AJX3_9GAMM|nr:MAG: hypothetical protein COA96_16300 [SAR86 cluster bacterium]
MTTIIKIIVGFIISLTIMSCQFSSNFGFAGIKGNGNVKTIERNISDDFTEIKVSRGLDVYITQSDAVSLKVQAEQKTNQPTQRKYQLSARVHNIEHLVRGSVS